MTLDNLSISSNSYLHFITCILGPNVYKPVYGSTLPEAMGLDRILETLETVKKWAGVVNIFIFGTLQKSHPLE